MHVKEETKQPESDISDFLLTKMFEFLCTKANDFVAAYFKSNRVSTHYLSLKSNHVSTGLHHRRRRASGRRYEFRQQAFGEEERGSEAEESAGEESEGGEGSEQSETACECVLRVHAVITSTVRVFTGT
ncbi:hypothetical protein HanIR_Chr11g0521361 [Helianthus annuus]|nr:hypothetical protein HanIR_Chr11g0521361 [Helianthus annuus]